MPNTLPKRNTIGTIVLVQLMMLWIMVFILAPIDIMNTIIPP